MERELVRIKDRYYILARSPRVDVYCRVLKHGESFGVFDRHGDIIPAGLGEQGLYHEGTRFLSRLEFLLYEARPSLLSSTVKEDNSLFTVDLTNPDIFAGKRIFIPKGSLHILRTKFLLDGTYYERVELQNFAPFPIEASFSFLFDADFADIFEVRGTRRERRGRRTEEVLDRRTVLFRYEGLDGVLRGTRVHFTPEPKELTPSGALFETRLAPRGRAVFFLTISFEYGSPPSRPLPYRKALLRARGSLKELKEGTCEIFTSNEQFNAWLHRSLADIFMMVTETPFGPYPYAGIPWFSAAFGRDGIITALGCLWVNPEIARGVLSFLAATQAREFDPEREAEPGKIVHEIRKGEMASTGEIPFAQYYGSVDATPLFVILAGEYWSRTHDRAFIEGLWPSIQRALEWISEYGDLDGDGFIEYEQGSRGLINKGWKDSASSVFHADGTLPQGPIALVEVQGYAYAAKAKGAELASLLGDEEMARRLLREASALRERFEEAFWCEELSTYALALDGEKRPCRVRASNPGHCLFGGIVSRERALALGRTLLGRDFFTGWGIRTLASTEALYNPLSYHNGSVWPHDNAMIAYGLCRYGLKDLALRIFKGLFEASTFFDLHRLPELFCGFSRRSDEGPTLYPVACSPQAWASASVLLLLQASLGLSFSGRQIRFHHPMLPEFLQEVWIRNLRVGEGSVDLFLKRYGDDVVINVERKRGEVELVIVK